LVMAHASQVREARRGSSIRAHSRIGGNHAADAATVVTSLRIVLCRRRVCWRSILG
jgi:hypothetical protein